MANNKEGIIKIFKFIFINIYINECIVINDVSIFHVFSIFTSDK